MLLNELKGVKRYYNKTIHDIAAELEQEHGIKFIGGGRYGAVYTHPSWDYVVKVVDYDPEYMEFVDYVIKHPNKHYPKIVKRPVKLRAFWTRRPQDTNAVVHIVKIEKLQPIQDQNVLNFIVENLENFSTALYRKLHKPEVYKQYDTEVSRYKQFLLPDGSYKSVSKDEIFEQNPWFESLCKAYMDIVQNVQGSPDVHAKNFMQRTDGTIVIIDPVWEGWNPYKAYDEAMRAEVGNYPDEDEPEDVSGPNYLVKKKQAEKISAAQGIADQLAHAFDENIPF